MDEVSRVQRFSSFLSTPMYSVPNNSGSRTPTPGVMGDTDKDRHV